MTKKTKLPPDEILSRARTYFGKFELEVENYNPSCCIELRNNIGFVELSLEGSNRKMEVKIHTREFEFQVKDFLRTLK